MLPPDQRIRIDLGFSQALTNFGHSQIEIGFAEHTDAVHLDLEVRPTVAVHVSFEEEEAAMLDEMQFAGLIVKALPSDEFEGVVTTTLLTNK